MLMNKTIDQLARTNSMGWSGHVLRKEDGTVLRTFKFELGAQRKTLRPRRT